MKKIVEFEGQELRAHKEYQMSLPLSNSEYKKLKNRIPYVPLVGESFDEINMIYPLRIPENPRVFTVNEEKNAFSMLLRYNKTSVSVIGDEEMKDLYSNHMGQFIYGVGTKMEKHKNGKTYHNIKLRGWLLVKLKRTTPKVESKGSMKNKK
ncbi:MAG: hypothetical protein KAR20_09880 [Candidatus Heimdallarchaeota archaeon]|nr:hypothetical protein [Candidatus Heimdallarchaeota archaeon]